MSLVIERPSVFYIGFHDWDRLVRCIPTYMCGVYNLYVTFEWLMVYDLESLVFPRHRDFPARRPDLFFSARAVPSRSGLFANQRESLRRNCVLSEGEKKKIIYNAITVTRRFWLFHYLLASQSKTSIIFRCLRVIMTRAHWRECQTLNTVENQIQWSRRLRFYLNHHKFF